MKKALFNTLLPLAALVACNKSNSDASTISLTASGTTATVGQTVTVTAATSANTVSWSASPAASTTKTYSVTTEKTNYFTFSRPGDYVISVRARALDLDTVHHCNPADSIGHHFLDSVWNHRIDSLWHGRGHHLGGCRNGQDSASIIIKVK